MSKLHKLLASGAMGGSSGPINIVAPVIIGDTVAGGILSIASRGYWQNISPNLLYTYQWQKNGVDIAGETSSSYVIRYADEGANITCVETVSAGKSASSNSVSIEVFWGNSLIIDAVIPTLGVTLDATTKKVSAVSGVKGVVSFTQTTDGNRPTFVDRFMGSKSFLTTSGSNRMASVAAFPQQYFSAMALLYGANGDVFCNRTSTGYLKFAVTSDLVTITNASGNVLQGSNSLTSNNTVRTPYWNYASGGFNVGVDGAPDASNSTVISSTPSGSFNIFNGNSGANAFIGHYGCIVWFNRALTSNEQEYYSQKLKSFWFHGYVGKLPFEGNANDKISSNITQSYFDIQNWSVTDVNAKWKSFNTTSVGPVKGTQVGRLERLQRNIQVVTASNANRSKVSYFASATSTGMTVSITQAQPFTIYGGFCILPWLQPPVTTNKILKYVSGSDNVLLYVDRATSKIRMQSQGALGSSGIELANHQNYKWILYKAVFNGASSELWIDIDGVPYSTTGILGGTTGLGGSVELFEDLSGMHLQNFIVYNGVPTTDEDTSIKAFLSKLRQATPDYSKGVNLIAGDDFQTYHRAFGNVARDPSTGKLYIVYSRGTSHVASDKKICMVESSDNGATWGTERVIIDNPSGNGGGDPNLTILSDGVFFLNYWQFPYPSKSYSAYSTDKGVTWSSPVEITQPDFYDLRSSGPVIELPNGNLLYPFHGEDQEVVAGVKNNLRIGVMRSTDRGLTWSRPDPVIPSVFTPTASDDWEEFNIRYRPATGDIYGLIRYEFGSLRQIWQVTGSNTNPVVWGTPTQLTEKKNDAPDALLNGVYGNPEWIIDSNGRYHAVFRSQIYEYAPGYYISDDQGVTWEQKEFPEPSMEYWVYGGLTELPDCILIVYFLQPEYYYGSVGLGSQGKAFGRVVKVPKK